jgi:predicted ABC-type ATPase
MSNSMDNAPCPPTITIIAGPNGAGKSSFASSLLKTDKARFINADLIASGLSPFRPETHHLKAGKIMLELLAEAVNHRWSVAIETTLSGTLYARLMTQWQEAGYEVVLYYLKLSSPALAVKRVEQRVLEGGHDIKKDVIYRRFQKSLDNLDRVYKPLVNRYACYGVDGLVPIWLEGDKDIALEPALSDAAKKAFIKAASHGVMPVVG